MDRKYLLFFLLMISVAAMHAQEIIIQENDTGFCSVDGTVVVGSTTVTGWTGIGYADSDPGIGKSISWEIHVDSDGTYLLVWRYAIGGNPGARNAKLLINGNIVMDTVYFPHTGTWSNWKMDTVDVYLASGDHKIRIEAYSTSGLGNYDYLEVVGGGVTAAACTPSYVLSVNSSNINWGTVSYEPVKPYYDRGTTLTLMAHANPGYFFQSWTGEEASADSVFTFTVKGNVNAIARFLPDGTPVDTTIIGYATVQDDNGTPYLVTGGTLGDTVSARTVSDLQTYLGSPNPYVVKFSGELTGTDIISVSSDKTLLGTGDTAHLMGIELSINQARNVIIRNMAISHVTPQDAIEINGKSKNIVIDHCEFYSDRDHGLDYYDGLLDIKNGSSFITVSWSSFHDHYKVSLISSGDEQLADTVIRTTFHHNYFYNCGSRLPSIRFGKAHIFNNYYYNCDDAINSRMDAWVRVERNYFDNVGTAVMTAYSTTVGRVQLIDNHFGSSAVTTTPTCDLKVPYPYQQFLDSTESLPGMIKSGVKTGAADEKENIPSEYKLYQNYSNPFNPTTEIKYQIPYDGYISLKVYDILGREVATLVDGYRRAGHYRVEFDASKHSSGVYFYKLAAGKSISVKKMVLAK